MCNTHTLYLLRRSGAEPEVFLLYRMGLSVKEFFFFFFIRRTIVYEVELCSAH